MYFGLSESFRFYKTRPECFEKVTTEKQYTWKISILMSGGTKGSVLGSKDKDKEISKKFIPKYEKKVEEIRKSKRSNI